ncbi:MAG: hypothetical protein RI926_1445 [Actinomycetota bacterium]|jgi:hypothetical protein
MSNYQNRSPSEIYLASKEELSEYLESEFIPEWIDDSITPDDCLEEIDDIATAAVQRSYGTEPIFKPADPVDNSTAIGVLILGIAALVVGIMLIGVLGPFGLITSLTSIFWFVMSRAMWNSQEDAEQNARQRHQRDVEHFYKRKAECVTSVKELMIRHLHRAIREEELVPERLQDGFVEVSIEHSGDYRYEWVEVIEEWSSQPEFPPGPAVQESKIGHQDYEEYCRQMLTSWGYLDAKTTRYSRDGGIDIETSELVVQCKHYSGFLGVRDVREIFGIASHHKKEAVVFCSGLFTSDAKKFAEDAGVALFILDETKSRIQNVNKHAVRIASRKQSI